MSIAPQINNGKTPFEPYNAINMVPFPSNTPFGNLLAAKMSIEPRIDYINLKLTSIYKPFPISIQGEIVPTLFSHLIDIPVEEVVYLIRVTTDNLICLWSILSDFSKSGKYESKIRSDCIWKLCEEIKRDGATHEFHAFVDWLLKFNEVTNAYKHSFAQLQLQMVSHGEPMVRALCWKQNDTCNPQDFKHFTLTELVTGFDAFYQKTNGWLTAWSKANPNNHQSQKYNL
jgi:hypothetical protein